MVDVMMGVVTGVRLGGVGTEAAEAAEGVGAVASGKILWKSFLVFRYFLGVKIQKYWILF